MTSRVSSPAFVGRRSDLDRLAAILDDASRGQSSLVLVAGEAGVGKTRFVDEVVRRAGSSGAVVLTGACVDLGGSGLPLAALRQALRTLTATRPSGPMRELVGDARAAVSRLLPDLDAPEVPVDSRAFGSGSGQARLFESILGLFRRLADGRGLLVVTEDAHWADAATLALLTFLARAGRDAGIVLLLTVRSDELHRRHPLLPYLAELERGSRVHRVDLARFDRRELAEQVGAIEGRAPDPSTVEALFARSGGNAFFVEELLAASSFRSDLPAAFRDVLLARTATVSDATHELLRTASASGARVTTRLLAFMVGREEPALSPLLREAVEHHLLVPVDGGDDEAFVFRHALIQEAIYGELLPGERARLHGRFADAVADAVRRRGTGRAAELAHHAFAAHDLPRTFEASVQAGREAEQLFALADAHAQYERALELWDRVSDAPARAHLDRIDLLALAARTASETMPPRAVALQEEAVALARAIGEPTRLGLLLERLGRYHWSNGDGFAALDRCREAVRMVPSDPPTDARARVTASLGQILMVEAEWDQARPVCEEAVAVARSTGARAIESHARNSLGATLHYLGDFEGGVRELRAALDVAREVDSPDDVARAYTNLVDAYSHSAHVDEVVDIAEEGFAYAEGHGLVRTFGIPCLCEAALALQRAGRWRDATSLIERAAGYEVPGTAEIFIQERQALLDVAQGRHDVARRRLDALGPLVARTVEAQWIAPVAEAAAELALWSDRPLQARATVAAALARLAAGTPGYVSRVGPLLALGVRAEADVAALARSRRDDDACDEARAIADGYVALMRSMREASLVGLPNFVSQAEAYWALCRAERARVEDGGDAPPWSAAAKACAAVPIPYARAYALWRQAEAVLAKAAARSAAGVLLREALAIANELGAEPLGAEIELLAKRGRVDVGPEPIVEAPIPDELAAHGLTSRERAVLELLADGWTNRQIATALFITDKTAGHHVSNILGKLGVHRRTEAAALAYRLRAAGTGRTVESDADGDVRPTRGAAGRR